jgi:hypothetical protein
LEIFKTAKKEDAAKKIKYSLQRIMENDFSKGSSDEGEMRRKYKALSIWFNEKIISEANQLN